MPYLCDVKNKLNSITMKYKSRSIAKVIVPVFLVVSLFAFTTHTTEQPEGTPLFITGITPHKSGMIVSQKGVQKVSIYSSDYKDLFLLLWLSLFRTGRDHHGTISSQGLV